MHIQHSFFPLLLLLQPLLSLVLSVVIAVIPAAGIAIAALDDVPHGSPSSSLGWMVTVRMHSGVLLECVC